jgi:hypothetical protein
MVCFAPKALPVKGRKAERKKEKLHRAIASI